MAGIVLEQQGKVVSVILDLPPVNALTLANYAELTHAFDAISARTDVHCVVLTARGSKAFCAGLDLKEFLATTPEEDPKRAVVVRATFKAIRQCAIPVIAAVNGPALGAGMVLAAASDIRIASEKATFGMPEINVGRCGGGAHVGRLVSPGMLRLLYFTGKPIGALEAYRIGLVEQVVPLEQLLPAAHELAEVISKKSPMGLRMAKEALNRVEWLPVEEGYELEQQYSNKLLQYEDTREATRASIERREPVFKGR
jgi:enoyl-CoA hydratase